MSASRMPTRAPSRPSATARLMATVLFPTPPFPAPTRTMFFTPGVSPPPCPMPGAARTWELQAISTRAAPAARSAASTSFPMRSLSGQAGVVSSRVSETASPRTVRSFTIPRPTMSRCSSGSITLRSAAVAACTSSAMAGVLISSPSTLLNAERPEVIGSGRMVRVIRLEGGALRTGGKELAAPGATLWVDLGPDPADLHWLGQRFGFHPLALEDCAHQDQRTKLEDYPGALFLVIHRLAT